MVRRCCACRWRSSTPTRRGRLLNRFSKDTEAIDVLLAGAITWNFTGASELVRRLAALELCEAVFLAAALAASEPTNRRQAPRPYTA